MTNPSLNPFDAFLEKESSKKKFPWNDVSAWAPEQLYPLWMKAGTSIAGTNFKDIDPNLTQELMKYLLRDESFKGDLNKGVLIIGGNGTGKTVYTKILLLLLQYLHSRKTPFYSGKQMEAVLRLEEDQQARKDLNTDLLSSTFCFDDMGEELDEVKVFGTTMQVGRDVLNSRHAEFTEKGHLTFGTSNLNMKKLGDKYGARVGSRIYEMFNVFTREGNDMRKEGI